MLIGFDWGSLLQHEIDILHEEKEPVGLSVKGCESVPDVELACSIFGVYNYGPGRYKLRCLPRFIERIIQKPFGQFLGPIKRVSFCRRTSQTSVLRCGQRHGSGSEGQSLLPET